MARASLFMTRKDLIKPFKPLRGPVRNVQACLSGREYLKQFSPLWRSCEARASLFYAVKEAFKSVQLGEKHDKAV